MVTMETVITVQMATKKASGVRTGSKLTIPVKRTNEMDLDLSRADR